MDRTPGPGLNGQGLILRSFHSGGARSAGEKGESPVGSFFRDAAIEFGFGAVVVADQRVPQPLGGVPTAASVPPGAPLCRHGPRDSRKVGSRREHWGSGKTRVPLKRGRPYRTARLRHCAQESCPLSWFSTSDREEPMSTASRTSSSRTERAASTESRLSSSSSSGTGSCVEENARSA